MQEHYLTVFTLAVPLPGTAFSIEIHMTCSIISFLFYSGVTLLGHPGNVVTQSSHRFLFLYFIFLYVTYILTHSAFDSFSLFISYYDGRNFSLFQFVFYQPHLRWWMLSKCLQALWTMKSCKCFSDNFIASLEKKENYLFPYAFKKNYIMTFNDTLSSLHPEIYHLFQVELIIILIRLATWLHFFSSLGIKFQRQSNSEL